MYELISAKDLQNSEVTSIVKERSSCSSLTTANSIVWMNEEAQDEKVSMNRQSRTLVVREWVEEIIRSYLYKKL